MKRTLFPALLALVARAAVVMAAFSPGRRAAADDTAAPRPRINYDLYDQGRYVYERNCILCHGEKGDGNGPAAAELKDGWGLPVKPADLREPHLRCGDDPADIFRILSTGMSGTPMLSFAATHTEEQRWDIVAYILSIRAQSSPAVGASPARNVPPARAAP